MYARAHAPTTRVRIAPVFTERECAALEDAFRGDDETRVTTRCVACETYDRDRRACTFVFDDVARAEACVEALMRQTRGETLVGSTSVRASDARWTCGYSVKREDDGEDARRTVAVRAHSALGIVGLTLIEDFVSEDEELRLAEAARTSTRETRLARRRVSHFGYEFSYATRDANVPCESIPAFVRETVLGRLGMDAYGATPGATSALRCDQITVNEYPRGVGLAPHVDTHSAFGETILSLSLLGGTVMEFRREGYEHRALYLPPRSLLIMYDEARYAWQHYIPHRKNDNVEGVLTPRGEMRMSYTFRERRTGACACVWPEACDSRSGKASLVSKRAAGATQRFAHLVGE